jgi:hypothetical protein
MTLSTRVARLEAGSRPLALPTVTFRRTFFAPCPHCQRHGGAPVRFMRETEPAAPQDAYTAHCRDGCGRVFVNRPAWDYLERGDARPDTAERSLVTIGERAEAWARWKAAGLRCVEQ